MKLSQRKKAKARQLKRAKLARALREFRQGRAEAKANPRGWVEE